MKLVEKHDISKSNPYFNVLDDVCFRAKNLYNATNYAIRQQFFENKTYLSYNTLAKKFASENQIDFRSLPANTSQQVMMMVDRNYKSFFSLLKKKKSKDYDKDIKIPSYLDKNGRYVTIFTKNTISKPNLRKGLIKLTGIDGFTLKTKVTLDNIQQVRIVPKNNKITVEIVYNKTEKPKKLSCGVYASIDLGLNNLACVAGNEMKPFIISGKPLKSINQFYNKRLAKLKSQLPKGQYTSKQIQNITNKRNNRIQDYLHKTSRMIINQLVSNGIVTLVIGKNPEMKQEINIGKRNNQNFVDIPHARSIDILSYKCELEGINVILTEESYTSKCSFLDNEKMCKHEVYAGKRFIRGLFRSSSGKIINSDLNGSLNILRKVIGEFNYNPIVVCGTPVILLPEYR